MTRRISLPIDGATERECGECALLYRVDDERASAPSYGFRCRSYGSVPSPTGDRARRHDACLTAEREHAAMERDARIGSEVLAACRPFGGDRQPVVMTVAELFGSDYERVMRELSESAADALAATPTLAERRAKLAALRMAHDGVYRPQPSEVPHAAMERDARLGKAVLRSISGMDPEGRANRLDAIATGIGPDYWEHDVLRAIAAALRAEEEVSRE